MEYGPRNRWAQRQLAIASQKKADYEKVNEIWRTLQERDMYEWWRQEYLAAAFEKKGDHQDAVEFWNTVLRLDSYDLSLQKRLNSAFEKGITKRRLSSGRC